jgi:hypothetical protein
MCQRVTVNAVRLAAKDGERVILFVYILQQAEVNH